MTKKHTKRDKQNQKSQPKLTHFLCLPILTSTSIPQLKASLAHLRASIPTVSKPEVQQVAEGGVSQVVNVPKPLFPDAALRPLGTLHLTLGVMSLGDKEKLQRAKEVLDRLDLVRYLKEAGKGEGEGEGEGRPATEPQPGASNHDEAEHGGTRTGTTNSPPDPPSTSNNSSIVPLKISLEGLFDFTHSRQVTRLLAQPVDPTERLITFATTIRQHFVDADLMGVSDKERELRLHATLVNTVYAHKKGRGAKRPTKFDGQEIREVFEEKAGGKVEGETGRFVWAADVDIDRVRICEMGAKKLDDNELGQQYVVVAEKSIWPPVPPSNA